MHQTKGNAITPIVSRKSDPMGVDMLLSGKSVIS